MSYDGDMRRVIRRALTQGWRHQRTRENHHKFFAPDMVSIVIASGTSCNNTGWREFLSEMRKVGYKEHDEMENGATTSLGELVKTAISNAEPLPIAHHQQISVRDAIRLLMREKPDHAFDIEEMYLLLHGRGHSNASRQNVGGVLHQLFTKGEITKLEEGTYRLSKHDEVTLKLLDGLTSEQRESLTAGLNVEAVDPDEAAIDAAIVVLVKAKEVLRRQKAFEHRKAELKRLLEEA